MFHHQQTCCDNDIATDLLAEQATEPSISLRKVQPAKIDIDAVVDDETKGASPTDRKNAIEEDMSVLKVMSQ
jgi:hypothetical protein